MINLLGHPINKSVVEVDKETSSRSSCDSVTSVVTIYMGANYESLASRLGNVRWLIGGDITIHSMGPILALEPVRIKVGNRRIKHHLSIIMLL